MEEVLEVNFKKPVKNRKYMSLWWKDDPFLPPPQISQYMEDMKDYILRILRK